MMIPINKPWTDEEEKREVVSVLENALTTAVRDGGKTRLKKVKHFIMIAE